MALRLATLVWGIAACALAQSQSLEREPETAPARQSEPFALYVFTMPRGAEDAKERMRAAVADVERIVELSDWVELVDAGDAADIVVEIRAYALAEDGSVHHVYADLDVLGEELFLVGVDEHERASRMGAASDLMEKLRDYCIENYVRLDAKRRGT